ncbi:cell division protein ZapA [Pelagovum pacificum]|uniref:Cell division protein ZapA n=1 Tax=Pelagovum pacificum TaxID=2588711 RepID=A0A5C5GEP1_9RHOB|nr:cell division protein ZapA [Pelagovum pacificum]QQA44818.1 cell division protein ZapA [Pelagovum pacificum]TNY32076.1 cell division protein ZapA [Pelagovum pacificum]
MPKVDIEIGGRVFEVACQEGEEDFLHTAASMLDTEAAALADQIGRLPESRMLLMAGLMLADRTAGLEEKLQEAEALATQLRSQLVTLESRPAPEPERIEVPVVPTSVTESMAELAARAEALASEVEEKAAS